VLLVLPYRTGDKQDQAGSKVDFGRAVEDQQEVLEDAEPVFPVGDAHVLQRFDPSEAQREQWQAGGSTEPLIQEQ
jgi:hypothetical protein